MGSYFSSHQPQEEDNRSLRTLLEEDDVPWNLVQARLSLHPEEAAAYGHSLEPSPLMLALAKDMPPTLFDVFVDAYEDCIYSLDDAGNNLLHFCNNAEVAKKIHARIPDAASQTASNGTIPLHRVQDQDTARVLLEVYPKGVTCRDKYGNLPIHYVVEDRAPGLIKLLVAAGSNVLARSKSGTTALDILCKRFERNYSQPLTAEGQELWELVVYAIGSVRRQEQPLLHSVIELKCPPLVVSQALETCPGQTRIRNAEGQTPLLIASSVASPEVIQLLAHADQEAGRMVDGEGRLPIDVAAENGLGSELAMHALVRAEPRAVDTRDLRDGLFPFLTAAIGEDANLDTIYQLLKAKPHVLMYSASSTVHEENFVEEQGDDASQDNDQDDDPLEDNDHTDDAPPASDVHPDKETRSMLEPPQPGLISEQGIQNNIGGHRAIPFSDSDCALTDDVQESLIESAAATATTEDMYIEVE